jgi:hypothetical protein
MDNNRETNAFANVEEYVNFLEDTLIPGLEENGEEFTANDFNAIVAFLKGAKSYSKYYKNKEDLIYFLEDTLIPDLKKNGEVEIAQDFRDGIMFLKKMKTEASMIQADWGSDAELIADSARWLAKNVIEKYKVEEAKIIKEFAPDDNDWDRQQKVFELFYNVFKNTVLKELE